MKTRAVKARTADLFAPAPILSPAPVPASMPVPERRVSMADGGLPPPTPDPARPRRQPLWYAVVFPQLLEVEQPIPALQRLSLLAQRFTSFVSLEPPNALLLEIRGSRRLFGPLVHLHARIDAAWGEEAAVSSAAAPSSLAALWCARAGHRVLIEDPADLSARLAQLPITCTAWDADRLRTLRAMGVTRMGELLRLPRDGLARRLGSAAVHDLDVALARRPAPRRAFLPRRRFRGRCDFETEIESVAYLQKALEPLLERCAGFLRERQAGVQSLDLRLRHRTRPETRVRLGLASVTSELRRLTDVLTQTLARLELAAPVRALELVSGALQALSAGSLDAFSAGNLQRRDTAGQLVERLRARLGENAVYGVSPLAEHRPEAAWCRVQDLPMAAVLKAAGMNAAEPVPRAGAMPCTEAMPRPVWLLGEPLPFSQREVLQLRQGALVLEQGPERIESGWWDGKGVARDYYVARHAHGAKLWVFQARQSKLWYLHGVFA
jgi:protein ImuB